MRRRARRDNARQGSPCGCDDKESDVSDTLPWRLRDTGGMRHVKVSNSLRREAADEIDRLKDDVTGYQSALRQEKQNREHHQTQSRLHMDVRRKQADEIDRLTAELAKVKAVVADVTKCPQKYIHDLVCSKQSGPRRDCSYCREKPNPVDVLVGMNEILNDALAKSKGNP